MDGSNTTYEEFVKKAETADVTALEAEIKERGGGDVLDMIEGTSNASYGKGMREAAKMFKLFAPTFVTTETGKEFFNLIHDTVISSADQIDAAGMKRLNDLKARKLAEMKARKLAEMKAEQTA